MNARGRFFEKAELDSNWPFQFVVICFGIVLAIFEGSLGLWSSFYSAPPMLSLIFLYWVALHHEKCVFLMSGFLVGLLSDILFSDLIGGRATAYIAVVFLMDIRRPKLLQGDFRDIWIDFSAVTAGVTLFQLILFSALNFAVPSLTPIAFQLGVTMIIFPIGYVLLTVVTSMLEKLRMPT